MPEEPRRSLRSARVGLVAAAALVVAFAFFAPDRPARESLAWRRLADRTVARLAAAPAPVRPELVQPGLPDPFVQAIQRRLGSRHPPGAAPVAIRFSPTSGPSRIAVAIEGSGPPRRITHDVPSWPAVLPTLLAIVAALVLRRALLPLVLGVAAGALLLENFAPPAALGRAAGYLAGAATTRFNVTLILFILGLIGMTAIGVRSGAVRAMVDTLLRTAQTARRMRVVGPLLGFLIFFDDYANTVVLGHAIRPITDRLRIPREKVAYIVDSTAAPVAGLLVFSTWIWYEVTQIQEPLLALGAITAPDQAYGIFLQAVPFRFYCIYALAFVLWNGLLARDFGPMLQAERRAASSGAVVREGARPLLGRSLAGLREKPGVPRRAWNMAGPLLFTLATILAGLILLREPGRTLGGPTTTGNVLAGGALAGALLAGVLVVGQRVLTLRETTTAFFQGVRAAGLAVGILFLAWTLGGICRDLGTAEYLSAGLHQGLPAPLLPLALFLLGALISFSTGSSFATMGILLPLAIPLAYAAAGPDPMPITVIAIAAVLDGAIFGDHCSPISDTTVLASACSGSDHLDHVRTQLPYALTAVALAVLVGYGPVAAGVPVWAVLPAGVLGGALVLRLAGRSV